MRAHKEFLACKGYGKKEREFFPGVSGGGNRAKRASTA